MKTNPFSSIGLFFGAIAFLIAIVHFSVGPLSPPRSKTLEGVVAEKVSAVKKGIISGLNGKARSDFEPERNMNVDKVLDISEAVIAVLAIIAGIVGGMREENRWGVRGALCFGGGTLLFHALVFSAGLIFCVLLLMAVIAFFTGVLA